MSVTRLPGQITHAGALRWQRWAVVGLLSLMLHLVVMHWAGSNFAGISWKSTSPAVLRTELILPPAAPSATVAPPPKPKPVRPQQPKSNPQPKPSAPAPAVAAPAMPQPAATPPTSPPPTSEMPAGMSFGWPDAAITDPAAAGSGSTQSAPTANDNRYKLAPPPSVNLDYAVTALREGQKLYGHGTIGWQFNGKDYAISGDAGILFISVLSFSSHGQTDDFGIAPITYTEKRFRRDATDTRFDRQRNLISFSASANTYPLQGGEQDRASIIWQLASIGRGDPARFVVDARLPLFIAGARDGETWNIRMIGEEEIEVGPGKLRTWHVQREPHAGSTDQVLDIWLAPEQEWYPVRLVYTEANGEYLDLSLSDIRPATAR